MRASRSIIDSTQLAFTDHRKEMINSEEDSRLAYFRDSGVNFGIQTGYVLLLSR